MESHLAELPPDPQVLGHLLMVQSTLQVMPSTAGMLEFVCRGLAAVPGVLAVRACAEGPPAAGEAPFALKTINRSHGWLLFRLGDEAAFRPYRPFVQNVANLLATSMENRVQQGQLQQLNEALRREIARKAEAEASLQEARRDLEQKVAERTADLLKANETLVAEVRERRAAEEALSSEASISAVAADLALTIITSFSLPDLAAAVLESAQRLTRSPAGFVLYIDPHSGQLQGPMRYQDTATFAGDAGGGHSTASIAGLRELISSQREPLIVNSPEVAGQLLRTPGHPPIQRFLSVPADGGSGIIGQVSVANRAEDYSEGDGRMVMRLARLFNLALQRAEQAEQRRLLSEQVQRAQKLESLGTLAGGIAHDFRNLLQIVLGYAELLQVLLPDATIGHAELQEVIRAAQRGAELTQQLLAFSRKREMRAEIVELNELVRGVARLLAQTLPRNIRVELRLASDLEPVSGDPGQLEQVLLNLGLNARDAMPNGGELLLGTEMTAAEALDPADRVGLADGRYVALSVRDTGCGISPEAAKRIFEPFFTTKDPGQGTGLGLSVAYGIARSHGGKLVISSVPGSGCLFTMLLPVPPAGAKAAPAARQAASRAPPGRTSTILVVDDEPAILRIAVQVLEHNGYHALSASSAEEALEVFRQKGRADLVLLDLDMPGMGGRACLRELRSLDPQVGLIVSSGHSGDQLPPPEPGLRFLPKPYQYSFLLETIQEALQEREGVL